MPDPRSAAGRAVLAEGREAVIHEWGDGLVLRLMRSPDAGPQVARSTAASESARVAGVRTPRVVDVIEVDGRPAQILERVDGPDMFAHLAANPLRLPRAARQLADVHVELHAVVAPPELTPTDAALVESITGSELVPAPLRERALATLATLPVGDRICHGDYHPGNVLLAEDGPTLIDWTGATRGDPVADFARTRLMLQVAELPPGAPLMVRLLTRLGRGTVWRLYDRTYRRARPVETDVLDRWTLVAAANRLTEGIEGERPALLERIRRLAGTRR